MSGAASTLIDHVFGIEWADLPADARAAAKTFLHDTLCVGVAGRNAFGAEAIFDAASSWAGDAGGCGVLGRRGARLTAPYAAFVNAYQIHAQEYDCVHEAAVAHPMATVVAALLAEAQSGGPVASTDFLVALCGGVDVVATLGVVAISPLKFFRPATAGVFGSVAAICRLRRLDRQIALDAFGYALAFASGTMQAHLEGKPALAVQVANAARSAVEAVDLARRGLQAAAASIDGPFGYLALFEDRVDPSVFDLLGRVHRITELSWKPFPTGRAAHGAIVATQTSMQSHRFGPDDVERMVYRAPPLIARLVGRPARIDMSVAHARLCFAYLGAVVLARGTVTLDDFSPDRLADPLIHALATRIRVEDDGSADPAAFVPAQLRIELRDGRVLTCDVTRQYGSPAWPLSRDAHLEKARSCLAFGGMADVHASLAETIDLLDACEDVQPALAALFD